LIESKNSFERLIWFLSNPIDLQIQNKKVALMLSLRQIKFGTPSVDEDKIEEILNDPLKIIDDNLVAVDKSKGQFYIFPEFAINPDFAKTKVGVKLSDLNVKASIAVSNITASLDKEGWEGFWQLFNLIQDNCAFMALQEQQQLESNKKDF
jgi:DEAD/DEAH box helicase domain-containing protein